MTTPDWIAADDREAHSFASEELALLPERKLLRFALTGRTRGLHDALSSVYRHAIALGDLPGDAVDGALASMDRSVLDHLKTCQRAGLLRRFANDPEPARGHGCGCQREGDGPTRERFSRTRDGAGLTQADRIVMTAHEQFADWKHARALALARFRRGTQDGQALQRFGRQSAAAPTAGSREFGKAQASRAEAGKRWRRGVRLATAAAAET